MHFVCAAGCYVTQVSSDECICMGGDKDLSKQNIVRICISFRSRDHTCLPLDSPHGKPGNQPI
jgi:hypothetical protein